MTWPSGNGWKSSAAVQLDCIGCHGNSTPVDFISSAGEPNYASTGAGAVRANDHKNHVDNGKFSCAFCHGDTVDGRRLLVVGDAVIGNPPGQLSLLGEQVMDDPAKLRASLRKLAALDIDVLLPGDGTPILADAGACPRELVATFPA